MNSKLKQKNNRKMKISNSFCAAALGLGLAATAQAQSNTVGTAIYITGSTAFRQQVFNALKDLGLTIAQSGSGGNNNFTLYGAVSDATSGSVLNLATVAPGLVGQQVTAYCDFTGSAEGVQALITPGSATYLDTVSGSFNHTGDDLAFCDVAQSSCPSSPVATGVTLNEVQLPTDASLHGGIPGTGVAVQIFSFVVNGSASAVKNITQGNFQDMFHSGGMALSFFTGNSADFATTVTPVGRYNLSGSRIATILDDQAKLSQALHQFALSDDGTTTPGLASTDPLSPPADGKQWISVGNNGYFTGGNVGKAIHNSSLNSAPPALAYLGLPDAISKVTATGGGNATSEGPISFNGQPSWVGGTYPTSGNWNIAGTENGSYTFWSYERLYASPSDSSSSFIVATFGPGLIAGLHYEITNTVPRTACLESEMNVYRNSDGGDVLHY
jgi:hypothetical protein